MKFFSEIAEHTGIRTAERGDVLFEKGDVSKCFYGVISGWVKLFNRHPDGNETMLGLFTEGETFAEATLYMGHTYPATACAATSVRLFEFEEKFFAGRILINNELCLGMFASLSVHLHRLVREVEQLQNASASHRLARFLLMLCKNDHGPEVLELPYEKSLIATRLGMKPETLSRNFAKLKPEGVTVDGVNVHIADVAKLRSFCS